MPTYIIYPSFFGRFFGGVKKIDIVGEELIILNKDNTTNRFLFRDAITYPIYSSSILGDKVSIKFQKNNIDLKWLNKKQLEGAKDIFEKTITNSLEIKIQQVKSLFDRFCFNEFLRDSNVDVVHEGTEVILRNYINNKKEWSKYINENLILNLNSYVEFYPITAKLEQIRNNFEQKMLLEKKAFFDQVESNPLTEQQRLAVIRNNDLNLVLAAAGTGKTSVMVAKALDLMQSGVAQPQEILILAYNKAAAKELQERLEARCKGIGFSIDKLPKIATFHALGRKILQDASVSTYLSEFVEDIKKLELWVSEWIREYICRSPQNLFNFLELSYQPVDPFSFKTKAEYDAYVRDNEYRTLQGERVKGYQELLIANWFFIHNVKYEYEAPYITKRRIDVGFDYRPDFYLPDYGVYLEHFGISRNGQTREDIDTNKYKREMESKRALHREMGTTLLETYHYDWVEKKLENRLFELTKNHQISLNRKSIDQIFKALENSGILLSNVQRYVKCLQAIRLERLDKDSIRVRLEDSEIEYANEYTELLDSLHDAYIAKLKQDGRIDFDDMIIRATSLIKSQEFIPNWKHILVDEFQDISMARMELLKSILSNGPTPILTVVGDDWQSIYRFSGGKLELTTRFDQLVGSHTVSKLEKTYRYNNSIADTAGAFVMENPEQYRKSVVTHTRVSTSAIYLKDASRNREEDIERKILETIEEIRQQDAKGSIAILARYNYLLKNAKNYVEKNSQCSNIKYWTFHGSKGLEADYCILVGFFQGKTGFPNQNKEEAVVEALLPSLDSFPHSEERRLMYVALTRAKKKAYLLADPMAPSDFIEELLAPKYDINILSPTFNEEHRKLLKCPICTDGYFIKLNGKFGPFYKCSSGDVCPSKPRICTKCGAPMLDRRTSSKCNNPKCSHEAPICDICGRPMKLRQGRYGNFWGCSGYGIKDDQCKNTRKQF